MANVKLIINGNEIKTKAEPFIYNGDVYAPVATIANALNIKWIWRNEIPAVDFQDRDYQISMANYDSGHVQVKPIGNNYFWYRAPEGTFIYKGLRNHDEASKKLDLPLKGTASFSELRTEEFIDVNGDYLKSELIIISLTEKEDHSIDRYIDIVQVKDEQVESLASFIIDEEPNTYVSPSFDSLTRYLYIYHYQIKPENSDKLLKKVEIYKWEKDYLQKVDELKK